MNKNLKRIIAVTVMLGTFSIVAPETNFSLLTTKAYASNSDADELDSIDLQDDDGESLELYTDSNYDDELDDDLSEGKTYYAETTTSAVKIDSVSGADDDNVRIFVDSDEYEVGDSISVDDGITTLKVRVYEDEYDDDENYDSNDFNEYKIKVEYNDEDDSNDEDTLDSLEIDDKNGNVINLYSDSSYDELVEDDDLEEGSTYYAKTSSDTINIETSGPDNDYVRMFKSTNDSAKGIESGEDISLSKDETLTVRIYSEEPDEDIEYQDDSDVVGEYKIKLKYIGDSSSTSSYTTAEPLTAGTAATISTNGQASISTTNIKFNQWVQNANGLWQYNDSLGNSLKSQWFFDKNYEKWYYLGAEGTMEVNSWILTGGKYYYVGYDGAMVMNTTIGIYKVGTDGAWIQ